MAPCEVSLRRSLVRTNVLQPSRERRHEGALSSASSGAVRLLVGEAAAGGHSVAEERGGLLTSSLIPASIRRNSSSCAARTPASIAPSACASPPDAGAHVKISNFDTGKSLSSDSDSEYSAQTTNPTDLES